MPRLAVHAVTNAGHGWLRYAYLSGYFLIGHATPVERVDHLLC